MGVDPKTDQARLEPYVNDIVQAAAEQGIHPAILAGVCLRETLAGWAPGYWPRGTHIGFGDEGHGFGLFQLDDRSHEDVILSDELSTPLGQARRAAWKLARNRRLLELVFPRVSGELLARASVAAYNARLGAVAAQVLAGRDVDEVTSPKGRGDYSRDVYARAERLCRAGLFPPLQPGA